MSNETITQDSVTQAVESVKAEYGRIVLAEIARRTGLSMARIKRIRNNGFVLKPNWNSGKHRAAKLDPYKSIIIEKFLKQGITNSVVIQENLVRLGYNGSNTTVRDFVRENRSLVPAPRVLAVQNPNRGRRYSSGPGEMFQMDWGFVNVEDGLDGIWKCACFAMVCHHCSLRYVEFFPSAKQENLFIGMIHAFMLMGVPKCVLTDNMKSVVNKRLEDGIPVWNKEYGEFQEAIGFETRLCKVAHPFTKGKVERLVRYMKDNFIQGRRFLNISELNREARIWCHERNVKKLRETGKVPQEIHCREEHFGSLPPANVLIPYTSPLRKISYDGFVNYENRRYGVPLRYSGREARVCRTGETIVISDPVTYETIVTHVVDWSRKPKICAGQWDADAAIEESPTAPVRATLHIEKAQGTVGNDRFSRFSILSRGGKR